MPSVVDGLAILIALMMVSGSMSSISPKLVFTISVFISILGVGKLKFTITNPVYNVELEGAKIVAESIHIEKLSCSHVQVAVALFFEIIAS
jgi:hypothetical protein